MIKMLVALILTIGNMTAFAFYGSPIGAYDAIIMYHVIWMSLILACRDFTGKS